MTLQKAILALKAGQLPADSSSIVSDIDTRALFIVTLTYLVAILTVPLDFPAMLIWFAVYPIILSPMAGLSYSSIFIKSLYVLPFVVLIGIFNPLIDHREVFTLGGITVTAGWLTFISILLRGILSVQALLLLVKITGFRRLCVAMRSVGLPKVLVMQLMMVYRFIGVLLEEAHTMQRAVIARGFGRKSFPLRIWTRFVGALLLRALDRSRHIHNAMLARGFDGEIYLGLSCNRWTLKDALYCMAWVSLFVFLRFYNISGFFFS